MLAPHVSVSHPDANLLAAFAELALSTSEREQVLAHLATCEDCRSAVVLALPAQETVAVPQAASESETAAVPTPEKQSWFSRPIFAWPTLRWGALAAGVVVAAALLVHYNGNSDPASVSKQAAPEAKSADARTAAPETSLKSGTAVGDGLAAERDKALADEKRADIVSKLEAPAAAQNKPVVNTKDAEATAELFAKKQAPASAPAAKNDTLASMIGRKPATATPSPSRKAVEMAEASSGQVQTEDSKLGNRLTSSNAEQLPLLARNETAFSAVNAAAPPITKAKPATAAEKSAPMQMAKASPQPAALAPRFDSPQAPQFAGVVTDPSGAAIANAKVTVRNQETGRSISTTTDQSGVYSLKDLPAGTYALIAEASGFKSVSESNVSLSPGLTPHNFRLPLGQTTEVVAVTGAAVQTEALRSRSSMASAKWALSSGMLRRSLDGGVTWQTSFADGRLLCYAPRGNEIWAGGKSGLLFHSTDNGATWTQVHASIGDQSLTDDVTRLEFRGASTLVLSTGNGGTWTSSDGGKTWSTR